MPFQRLWATRVTFLILQIVLNRVLKRPVEGFLTRVTGRRSLTLHKTRHGLVIIAFTRELAPQRVRVNAVGPGFIEVNRYFDRPGYTTEFSNTLVPWGRVGLPSNVAPVVCFLASNAADFITGQILFVDGGTEARMGLWDHESTPQ
jgi:hypothetical protein